MSTPSKFTEDRRSAILEAFGLGLSERTAAMHAGIDHATLGRWLAKAERARPGGVWHDFHLAACRARTRPRLRLAESAFRQAHDDGHLALKMLSKLEPAYRVEPVVAHPAVAGVLVRLELPGEAAPLEAVSEVRALPPA